MPNGEADLERGPPPPADLVSLIAGLIAAIGPRVFLTTVLALLLLFFVSASVVVHTWASRTSYKDVGEINSLLLKNIGEMLDVLESLRKEERQLTARIEAKSTELGEATEDLEPVVPGGS